MNEPTPAPAQESATVRVVAVPWYRRQLFSFVHVPWIFLAFGLLPAGHAVYEITSLLAVPSESSRTEAFVLDGSLRVAQGKSLYMPIGQPPCRIHVYNPLTYLPAGLAGRVFGLGSEGISRVGRAISYIPTWLLVIVLVTLVYRNTGDWKAAAFAGAGVFYYHLVTLTDAFRFRPEGLGLLFTFAGVAVFLSRWRFRLYGAAALFFLAFLVKQSYVAAPAAAFLYLLVIRDFGSAARFCATMVGQLAAFFALMGGLTGAKYFSNTFYALASNEMMILHHMGSHRRYLFDALYGLLYSLPIAAYLLVRTRRGAFLPVYVAVSALWSVYSAGKIGADYNYYNELAILLVLVTAMALGSRGRVETIGVVLLLAVLNFQLWWTAAGEGIWGHDVQAAVRDLRPYIQRYRAMPGRKLITEEIVAVHVGEPAGIDWFLLEHLASRGALDLSPLYEEIERGVFDVAVFAKLRIVGLEADLESRIARGPYEKTYEDGLLVEYRRRPAGR